MPATTSSISTSSPVPAPSAVSLRHVFSVWWPLAASWLLMSAELPALSAIVARLPDPDVNLAAYGGIVFPLALIIESPIIMLLAASTALSKDWDSFARIRRFMVGASVILTGLHVLVAFTPLYDFIARYLLGVPPEIVEPGRVGLRIMLPWTGAIAYRRFHQGVLIRFGRSVTVGRGTLIRLGADGAILAIGFLIGSLPGIVVATCAVITGILCEAVYVAIAVRPVLRGPLRYAPPVEPSLTWSAFYAFYIPLVMTSLISLLASPINSASLGRMPLSLESLAAWPALSGLVFMFRSLGISFNEVVVSILDTPNSVSTLRRFAAWMIGLSTAGVVVITVTPLSRLWFGNISALEPELTQLARTGLWLTLPLPALAVLQSWYQGAILHGKHTRGLTESMGIYLAVNVILLLVGVAWGKTTGFYVGWLSLTVATLAQTGWLWLRSREAIRQVS